MPKANERKETNYNMESDKGRIISNIKEQAQLFLLDSGEFYPFAVGINKFNELKPISASTNNDFPKSEDLIILLKNHITEHIANGIYKIAAIAIDVRITKNESKMDALEIQVFTSSTNDREYFGYSFNNTHIEFYRL